MSSVTNGSQHGPKVRADGQGSVYQRSSDGLWFATVPPRFTASQSAKRFSSKFRDVAEMKRRLWCKRHGVILKPDAAVHEIDEWMDAILEHLEPVLEQMVERALARRLELAATPGVVASASEAATTPTTVTATVRDPE